MLRSATRQTTHVFNWRIVIVGSSSTQSDVISSSPELEGAPTQILGIVHRGWMFGHRNDARNLGAYHFGFSTDKTSPEDFAGQNPGLTQFWHELQVKKPVNRKGERDPHVWVPVKRISPYVKHYEPDTSGE